MGAVALLLLGSLGWCALARRARVRARGGVAGREGPGWIYRDGDTLVFVHRGRRYALPVRAQPHQAVRRYRRTEKTPIVSGLVFRDAQHVTHTVGFADARAADEWLAWSSAESPRLGLRALVPRSTLVVGLVGAVVLCRSVLVDQGDPALVSIDLVACLISFAALTTLLVRAALAAGRPAVVLTPVSGEVPGFDGSMPRDERYRAERMPLHDLAEAVQGAEAHRDVEDNDQLRAPLKGLLWQQRAAVVFLVAAAVTSVLFAVGTASFWSLAVLIVVVVVTAVAFARRPGLVALRNARNTSSPVHWRDWPSTAVWRRLDGAVFLCLFDGGGLVWLIRVDRVCAAGADVELNGDVAEDRTPAIRANGAWLLALEAPRRVTEWDAQRMRGQLVDALTAAPGGLSVRR